MRTSRPLLPPTGRPPGDDFHDLVGSLYRAHALGLVRLAKLLVGDQASAEDVVQDVFLGLHRTLPALTDHDQVLPYLRAAVLNRSRSLLRKRRRALLFRAQHEPPVASAEAAAMLGEDRRAVKQAVARLPRRAREVLILRYYQVPRLFPGHGGPAIASGPPPPFYLGTR